MTLDARTTQLPLLFLALSPLALAQSLSPSAPSKEYIRQGGQIIAIENAVPPPTVSVTAPAAGATVYATVSVSATAQSDLSMASVQFLLDGADYGSVVTGGGPAYSISWNTTTAASGAHTLSALATDTLGQQSTSATVTVTVGACVANLTGAGLAAGAAPATIDLSWSGLTGASTYEVLRGAASGGPYTALGTTSTTAYADTNGLVDGGAYFYVVQPLNASGAEMCQSNQKEITVPVPGGGRQ